LQEFAPQGGSTSLLEVEPPRNTEINQVIFPQKRRGSALRKRRSNAASLL